MGRKILLWKQNELEGNKSSKDVNDDSSDIQHNRPSPDSDESLKKRKKSSKVNSETKKTWKVNFANNPINLFFSVRILYLRFVLI